MNLRKDQFHAIDTFTFNWKRAARDRLNGRLRVAPGDFLVLRGHPGSTGGHPHLVAATLLCEQSQLLAMDASARVAKKDAATCDKRCEWQSSANQENVERALHFRVIPGSMAASGR